MSEAAAEVQSIRPALWQKVPWILAGTVLAGLLNYAFGFSMTLLMKPADYTIFVSANSILLITGTVANAGVPWLLAREIAARPDPVHQTGLTWAALTLNAFEGLLAAVITASLASTFAGWNTAIWVGCAAFTFFVGSTGMGWAQGHRRFGLLALLIVTEVLMRVISATVFIAIGWIPAGAYVGAAIGATVIFLGMLKLMAPELRPSHRAFSSRLWGEALSNTSMQALVTALTVSDVLFISLRFHTGPLTASYQVAATLARTPLFVAIAFATEMFPAVARDPEDPRPLTAAIERTLHVTLPVLAVVMTLPVHSFIGALPAGYHDIGSFLIVVGPVGAAYALIIVESAGLRAAGATRPSLLVLLAGVLLSVGCLIAGSADGIVGMAVGAGASGLITAAALGVLIRRRWRGDFHLHWHSLLVWLPAGGALFAARDHLVIWLILTTGTGLFAIRAAVLDRS